MWARIKARKDRYKVWCASLTVNTRGMPLTTNTLRNLFDAARADAAAPYPTIAAEIKAMRFYDLRAKAAVDVVGRARRAGGSEPCWAMAA